MAARQIVLTSAIVASLASGTSVMTAASSASVAPTSGIDADAPDSRFLFISGHSLTDRPFPDYLSDMSAADGVRLIWKMHHIPGSSILQRLNDGTQPLAQTKVVGDRGTQPVRDGRSASDAQSSAVMIITEQHRVLDSLMWQNAVPSLRSYHDRFIAANKGGQTYFFAPWISISDRADPHAWIAYEKEALPVWQCIVAQVNDDLAAAHRADRVAFIPTSWALARLVEHITARADLAGFEGFDMAAKMDAIFADDVHLTQLGTYFTASVSYATIYSGELPDALPASLNADQARTLRSFAGVFVQDYGNIAGPSEQACASGISMAFASHYTAYTERTYHRAEQGIVAARLKRIRDTIRFAWRFGSGLK